jgi:hypothetical protein
MSESTSTYYDTFKLQVPECTIIVTGKCNASGKGTGHFSIVILNPQGDIVGHSSASGYYNYNADQFAHKELAHFLRERECYQ